MSEKVTTMVLKVDLECHRCYKKVKKVLGKFSEIRDQVYDEKANTVTIKVLSSRPEKLRDKIWSKGGKSVVSIDIKEPEKKKEAEEGKKKEADQKADKKETGQKAEKKETDQKAEKKNEAEKPKKEEKKEDTKPEKLAAKEPEKAKAGDPPKEGPSPPKGPLPVLVAGYPPSFSIGAPLPALYGRGGPAPGQNGEYIGKPIYDSYGGGRGYYNYNASHCDYFSEENPSACVVM